MDKDTNEKIALYDELNNWFTTNLDRIVDALREESGARIKLSYFEIHLEDEPHKITVSTEYLDDRSLHAKFYITSEWFDLDDLALEMRASALIDQLAAANQHQIELDNLNRAKEIEAVEKSQLKHLLEKYGNRL